jgi:hypothetical protein
MLVRVLIGPRPGQIEDVEPEAARQMIANGRASEVDWNEENRREVAPVAKPVVAETAPTTPVATPELEPTTAKKQKRRNR